MAMISEMVQPHMWDNENSLIDLLSYSLNVGRLSLALGSGVSVPFGLPSWSLLVSRLYMNENEDIPNENTEVQSPLTLSAHLGSVPNPQPELLHPGLHLRMLADGAVRSELSEPPRMAGLDQMHV